MGVLFARRRMYVSLFNAVFVSCVRVKDTQLQRMHYLIGLLVRMSNNPVVVLSTCHKLEESKK